MPASNRLPSDSDWAKQKGPAVGNTGDDVGPQPTVAGDMLGQFQQVNAAAVGSTQKGASLAQRGIRGGPEMPGSTPLQAHTFGPNNSRGISPKRGAGKSTPPTTVDKGMD